MARPRPPRETARKKARRAPGTKAKAKAATRTKASVAKKSAAKPARKAAAKGKPLKAKVQAGKRVVAKPASPARARKSAPGRAARKARKAIVKPALVYHPGPVLDNEAALEAAIAQLTERDPEFVAKVFAIGASAPLRRGQPGFEGLARIIVSQQVSTASADAIFGRLASALAPLSAAQVLAASDETLRSVGLSSPKIRGLRAAAQAEIEGLDLTGLGALVAEDAHRKLVAIKGVGPWTADIFLLFCLGHPDAFPAGDLALQESARLALDLKKRPDAAGLEKIAERWRPVRGIAARMLWAYYRFAKQRSGMALADETRR